MTINQYAAHILLSLLAIGVGSTSVAASGITYTGRILKGEEPVNAGIVRFDVWIKTKDNCVLYYERRNIDMAGSGGTYAFEVGDANIIPGSQSFPQTGIQVIADIFNNNKSRANGDVDSSLPCSTFNPAADEGRLMTVSFTPPAETAQALPDLVLTPVPTAFQAFNANKINGYGTGDLLKVNPSVDQTTHANSALNQAQYDEFWKLLLGTSTTYLKTIPAMGGDVTGTVAANTVVKIRNIDIDAPAISGNVLTYNGTKMVWQAGAAGGITSINGQSGATQSFVATTPLTLNSSGDTHTFAMPAAASGVSGYLSAADWAAFNAKQSSSLGAGQVWVGNAGNGAQARTLGGDIASISDTGIVALKSVGTVGTYYKVVTDAQGRVVSGDATMTATDLPTLADGKMWVGNGSNVATEVNMSGDATMDNAGVVTLKNTGAVGTYTKVITDAQGRVTGSAALVAGDITGALGYTPVNKAGDTMSGSLMMGAGTYIGLGAGSTAGTVAGQMWLDGATIKYYDGTGVKALGVAGAGITSINGSSAVSQSFAAPTTAGATAPAWNTNTGTGVHTLDIPMAATGGVTAGLISNAEYASLNGKLTSPLTTKGDLLTRDGSTHIRLPVGSNNEVLTADSNQAGGLKWAPIPAAGITDLTGDVTATGPGSAVASIGTGKVTSSHILDGEIIGNDMNFTGVNIATSGIVIKDNTGKFFNFACGTTGDVATWTVTGWTCQAPAAAVVNNKAALADGKMWVGNGSNVAAEVNMSGDATMDNAGVVTLKNTGVVGTYTKVITDAQGRVTGSAALVAGDITGALGYTPVNKAGDTMGGALNMGGFDITNTGSITMANNKYFTLSSNTTPGNTTGQIWLDGATIKYYDGTGVKALGVAGAGITSINGSSAVSQSFAAPTTAGATAPAWNTNTGTGVHTLDIPMAATGGVTAGLISNAEYASLNGKLTSPLTTKGDLLTRDGSTHIRLPVGSNNEVLTADSTQAGGLKWAPIPAAGITDLTGDVTATGPGSAVASIGTGKVTSTHILDGTVVGADLNFTGVNVATSGLVIKDNTGKFFNFACGTDGDVATWTVTGWTCQAPATAVVNNKAALASGKVWVGNGSNVATEVNMSGDATMDNAGVVTLKSVGAVGTYTKVITDAQGRVTGSAALVAGDITGALTYTPVNKAGDTMSGSLMMGAGTYIGLGAGSTAGTVAGQMWLDGAVIKYYDGTGVKALGVAGAGITSMNGSSAVSQSFAAPTTAGASAPAWSTNTGTGVHTLDIPMAATGGVTAGLISNAEYASLNGKLTSPLTTKGDLLTRDGSTHIRLPVGSNNEVLTADSTQAGGLKWAAIPAAGITALTGDVTATGPGSSAASIGVGKVTSSHILDGEIIGNDMNFTGVNVATSGLVIKDNTGKFFNFACGTDGDVATWTVTGWTCQAPATAVVSNKAALADGKMWVGNGSNVAAEVNMSGDATMDNAGVVTLKSVGAVGTYTKVITDAQGRVVNSASLNATDINTALTYTPVNRAGDTMAGDLNFAAGKYLGINSAGGSGSVEGQIWYNAGKVYYRDGSGAKELGVAGAGITSFNGSSVSSQTFAAPTTAGATAPAWSTNTGTGVHTLDIPMAATNGVTAGLVSHSDYASMMAKQTNSLASMKVWIGNAGGGAEAQTLSGDIASVTNAGSVTVTKTTSGEASKILSLDANSAAMMAQLKLKGSSSGVATIQVPTNFTDYALTLPASVGLSGDVLTSNGAGGLSWAAASGGTTLPTIGPGQVWVGNSASGAQARALSGDVSSITDTGLVTVNKTITAQNSMILSLDTNGVGNVKGIGFVNTGTVTLGPSTAASATYSIKLPSAAPTGTQFMQTDASGNLSWVNTNSITDATKLPLAGGTMTGALITSSGIAAAPSLGVGQTTSGLYSGGVNILSFTTASTERMRLAANGDLGFQGAADQQIIMDRITTTTAGKNLTIQAGGGRSGQTNLNGGTLVLSGGISTGSGTSQIEFRTATGASGTADRTPATRMTILGNGNVGVAASAPTDTLQVSGTIRGATYANSNTTIDWSRANTQSTTAGCTGTQYTFSNMRDGGVYTLVITGTFSANCTFGQTSPDTLSGTAGSGDFYFLPANSIPSGANSIYSFMRVGNSVYVQWNSGFAN